MSDHEEILAFRRPPALPTDAESSSGTRRAAIHAAEAANSDTDADRAVLPLARPSGPQPFTWQDLRAEQPDAPVQIRLGKTRLPTGEAHQPKVGAIVVLDRSIDEPVEIVVAGEVIALGRLVVAQNKLAIQVCQIRRGGRVRRA